MLAMLSRLVRLRRLALVSILPPMMVVAIIAVIKGDVAYVLAPLAVGLPLAHILRFPSAWMETLAVSITLTILLALTGTIGADVGVIGLAVRILGLAALGGFLMLVLTPVIATAISVGGPRAITHRAALRSRLAPEALRPAMTLYPGRKDDRFDCSPANAEGMFPITMTIQGAPPIWVEQEDYSDMSPEEEAAARQERAEHMAELAEQLRVEGFAEEEIAWDQEWEVDPSGAFEVTIYGLISASDATRHDIITLEEGSTDTIVTRMEFIPRGKGTLVKMEERSAPMPPGYALGFWLQDYGADYLRDELSLAEGRPRRTVRAGPKDDLLSLVARWMVTRRSGGGATPAE